MWSCSPRLISPHWKHSQMMIGKALIVGVLAAASLVFAAPAHAIDPNCAQQPWWYGSALRMTVRTLCDGPIRADGSWMRARNFYADAYYVPYSCSWGPYYGSCNGGYWMPVFDTGVDVYPVPPDTVLPDEPGHLGPDSGPQPVTAY